MEAITERVANNWRQGDALDSLSMESVCMFMSKNHFCMILQNFLKINLLVEKRVCMFISSTIKNNFTSKRKVFIIVHFACMSLFGTVIRYKKLHIQVGKHVCIILYEKLHVEHYAAVCFHSCWCCTKRAKKANLTTDCQKL